MAKNTNTFAINGKFLNKDILSLDQFTSKDITLLFSKVGRMKKIGANARPSDVLKGNIITLIFYEPSSRTMGSFSAAVKQLGGQTIEISDPQHFSSVAKGETLEDTIRVFEAYSDAIVIRHPVTGTAVAAANSANFVPIINAGDGIGEHPTQALLDLYTIYEKFGRLDNLKILFAGDMLNGRTVHSVLRGISKFKKNKVFLLSPKELRLTKSDFEHLKDLGLEVTEIENETDILKDLDVWYWTRVQKERFKNTRDYEKVKNKFIVTKDFLDKYAKKNMILMHPLPRVGEIETSVDEDPRAVYLKTQVRNGMYVRMALIALILGKV